MNKLSFQPKISALYGKENKRHEFIRNSEESISGPENIIDLAPKGREEGVTTQCEEKVSVSYEVSLTKDIQHLVDDIALKYKISKREQEVLGCILNRYSNQEIATKLYVSVNTVKFHVGNLFTKLGIKNRGEVRAFCKKFKENQMTDRHS